MAAESTKFLIDLQARFSTLTPAQKALSSLEKQIVKERDSLGSLEKKLATANAKLKDINAGGEKGTKVNIAARNAAIKNVESIQKQIDASKTSLSTMNAALPAMKKNAEQSAKLAAASKAAAAAKKAQTAVDKENNTATRESVKSALAYTNAMQAAATAYVAVVAIVVASTIALIGFALASADAARSTHLLDVAAAGGVAQGHELIAVVSQLARKVPLARSKLDEMAKSLLDAKLAGRDMQLGLEAIATVASARGPQAASAIEAIAKQSAGLRRFVIGARDMRGEFVALAGTGIKAADVYAAVAKTLGISVAAAQQKVLAGTITLKKGMEILATVAKDKFGATIAGQMISLTTQIDKLKENLGLLFGGVNINKFLVALEKVTSLLSQDTYTGFVLKKILGEAMTGFFDAAALALPYVKAGLIGVAIGVLTVYLYFLKAKKAVGELAEKLGLSNATKGIDGIELAMSAGIGAVGALVAIVGLLGAAFVFASIPIMAVLGALAAVGYAAYAIGGAVAGLFTSIKDTVAGALDSVKGMSLADAGKNIIMSLIKGIAGMAGNLVSAVWDVATLIPKTVAGALDMHSPSRIGVAQGGNYTLSMAKGGRDKAGEVEDAGEAAAQAMVRGGGKGVIGGAAGSGTGGNVFHIYVTDTTLAERVREILAGVTGESAKAATT